MNVKRHVLLQRVLRALVLGAWSLAAAAGEPPMGTPADMAYARRLWSALGVRHLVGPRARPLKPFFGGARPHGMILELTTRELAVGDHRGFLILKRNYDGEGVSVARVAADRARYLSSVTVMYRREAGYDPDNQDWFWVKYKPDGTLFRNPGGLPMAGRILKGPSPAESGGCIYCHASAGGGDYVFYPEIEVPGHAPGD